MKRFIELTAAELGIPQRQTEFERAELQNLAAIEYLKRLVYDFKKGLASCEGNSITMLHHNSSFKHIFETDGISEHFCKLLQGFGWVVSHEFDNSGDDPSYCHRITVHLTVDRERQ